MNRLRALYDRLIFPHPVIILAAFGLLLAIAAIKFGEFRLDASAESLVLENDRSLEQYRQVNRRFTTSDDFLIVTYTPEGELFSEDGLARLGALRDELQGLEAVGSTNSILNVPLLHSPDLTLDTVDSEIKTLDDFADLAGDELLELLGVFGLGETEANEMIMAARAHWFDDEEEPVEGDEAGESEADNEAAE